MPIESTTGNQGRQIVVLIEKVDNLTSYIRALTEKFDNLTSNLVVFQKDYYVEHQRVLGDVSKHEQVLADIRKDVEDIENCANDLKTRTTPIEDIKRIKEVLYGNGGIGLIAKVSKIDDWIANQVWFQRLMATAIVGQIVALIFLILRSTPVK